MSFNEEVIQKVWEKGIVDPYNDPNLWRKDQYGAWMHKPAHGDRNSVYGWEIHHIDLNGGDDISSIIPLHWENNLATADTGKIVCATTANGTKNVKR